MKTNLVGIENKNIGTIVVFFVIAAERQISLIDFEYCAYNYRSFDIANHFLERCYDYTLDVAPFFTIKMHDYPTREQQVCTDCKNPYLLFERALGFFAVEQFVVKKKPNLT